MMEEPYYMAGVFEHVAKMSRMPESPRMLHSVPPVRFRASVQPLTDLSDLPKVRSQPLTSKYRGTVPSSDSEMDQEPHRKLSKDTSEPESLEDSLQRSSNLEKLRNKQRQVELKKEKENEALAAKQAERPHRQQDRQPRKTDWAQVQAEIEAVIDQPISHGKRQPSPAARRRQEARIQRWRKSGRVASAEQLQSQKVGRNMRAAPLGHHSEPNSPSSRSDTLRKEHQIPGSHAMLALDDRAAQLVSYRPIDKELLHRMTQQTRALQRLGDAARVRRGWESASQAESHSETPSMLERLLTEGTTNGLQPPPNQRPVSAHHRESETDRESTQLSHRGQHSPTGDRSPTHHHGRKSPSSPSSGKKSHRRRKAKDKRGSHKMTGGDEYQPMQPEDQDSPTQRRSSTRTPSPSHKLHSPDRPSSSHQRSSPEHRRCSTGSQPSPTHRRTHRPATAHRRHSNASQQSSSRQEQTRSSLDDRGRHNQSPPAGAWNEAPSGVRDIDRAKEVLRGLSTEERAALARVLVRDLQSVGESEL